MRFTITQQTSLWPISLATPRSTCWMARSAEPIRSIWAGFKVQANTTGADNKVVVGMRPEDIIVTRKPAAGATEFTAYSVLPAGADSTIIAHRDSVEITIKVMGISSIKMDEKIWLNFKPDTFNLFDKKTGNLVVMPKVHRMSDCIRAVTWKKEEPSGREKMLSARFKKADLLISQGGRK